MVYLARKNGEVICHADPDLMREWDGLEPEMEITEEEFASYGNQARIVNGEIFLGRTDEETDADSAKAEIERIKAEIASRDYRALKAQRLHADLDELYPGETDWYKIALTAMGSLEAVVRVVEPEFKA